MRRSSSTQECRDNGRGGEGGEEEERQQQ